MDSTAEQKQPEQTAPEIPGMKEALARMDPDYWKDKSHFAKREPSVFEKKIIFPTIAAIRNMTCALETPSVLVTALPLVQNLRLKRALADIGSVPEGQELVAAAANVPKINLNPDPRVSGGYIATSTDINGTDIKQLSLEINIAGIATSGTVVGALIHELQHQRQVENKVLRAYGEKNISPVEHLWYNRMTEADAQATATDILWRMKEAGKPGHWYEAKHSGSWVADVAAAYEKKVAEDPHAVENGTAKRAAFDAWFTAAGGAVQQHYNTQGMLTTPNFPKAEEMHKAGKPFGHLTVEDIEKIGDLSPVNYLKIPGGAPLDSEKYRGADFDRNQAAFLHHAHTRYAKIEKGEYEDLPKIEAAKSGVSAFMSPPAAQTRLASVKPAQVSLQRAPKIRM
ncbi:MAG TPA: DUF6782 family putative metallopeptidase [Patescibacteria group bacterium]|nr:DUF6782 family putative metallopeptidase [Patescibacteria group bacterium]